MKTVIIQVTPTVECWGNFRKWCNAKGLNYQTLANSKRVPRIGEVLKIKEYTIYKVEKH